jgi:cytoskeletal protein RodZ
MTKREKVQSRTAVRLMVVAIVVLAAVNVAQVASAGEKTTPRGKGATTSSTEETTTTVAPTSSTEETTTTVAPTSSTEETTTTVAPATTIAPTTTQPGGQLPFTGAPTVPVLLAAAALFGLGAVSLFAGTRRRRRRA